MIPKPIWFQLGLKVIFSLALGYCPLSFAQAFECKSVRTYQEAIQCALSSHPDVLRASAERQRSESLKSLASQRPNLELAGKGLKNLNDSTQTSGEMGLSYTFELGGKRSARIKKASLEGELGKLDFNLARANAFIKISADLYLLKYLTREAMLIDEGIASFEQILRAYRNRMKLSPEQDVASTVFSLALGDYKIKKAQYAVKKVALLKSIELQTGTAVLFSEQLFPEDNRDWPDLSAWRANDQFPQIKSFETVLNIAEAERIRAESEAWPDLKIGPDFEWSKSSANFDRSLGLTLTLPLPLWNRNQGGIALAHAEVAKAKVEYELSQKELGVEKARWLAQYEVGLKSIRDGISRDEMQKKHDKLMQQFKNGLIPSALVIEANRQILDFTKSRNEQELEVLTALWNLKQLQGTLFKDTL